MMRTQGMERLYIAGHTGMVRSALVRAAGAAGWADVVTATRREVDLTRQAEVEGFFDRTRPEVVIVAAARVGGIVASRDHPATFLYENLAMAQNVIDPPLLAHGPRAFPNADPRKQIPFTRNLQAPRLLPT